MNPMEILNRPSRPLKRSNPPMVQRSCGTNNDESVVMGSKVNEINPFEPINVFKN